ncbi:hypothetical protein ACO22_06125, partial [Paracoccidioides brasiliensis]
MDFSCFLFLGRETEESRNYHKTKLEVLFQGRRALEAGSLQKVITNLQTGGTESRQLGEIET